ncbi:hypothetical protein [Corynebacterium sp. TAE3-ERU30]|uniref:hypothetical protein n=1 Tax=Corynebacterium sp. TAE3-ERU30 TaxID=2849496 RepID=UPI002106B04F|nr:hypothetical protein [Corynebacterium sp. TAE3-ERU30]
MLEELDRELLSADDAASDLIDGVRVRWMAPGRAARDETAFRHALAEGDRLHGAGHPMKDTLLIDARKAVTRTVEGLSSPHTPSIRTKRKHRANTTCWVCLVKKSALMIPAFAVQAFV